MIVYTKFQGIQKSGFAMISTADDQGDALWNSHSDNFPLCGRFIVIRSDSGEINGTECFIGREEIPLSRGSIAPSATNATSFFLSTVPGLPVDLRREKWFVPVLSDLCFCKRSVFYTGRKKIEQNLFQFGCINGTAICRKTNKKSGSDASDVISHAVLERISCPQWLTEIRPLLPEPFARKE